MKKTTGRRMAALLMALLMLAQAAAALTFSDTELHWSKEYVSEMADKGIITGYTDGTFRPENSVTTLELLVLCSRILGVEAGTAELVYADYESYLSGVMGEEFAWAQDELALCVETGIITKTELEALYRLKRLNIPAEKELLSVFVVRAMGLEDEIKGLGEYSMPFKDAANITKERKPYVYLLYKNKIVEGTPSGNFDPKSGVTRAVTATMLYRAMAYMEENGIRPALSEKYESGKGEAGMITGVSASGSALSVKLYNAAYGEKTVKIPFSASFTEDGQAATYAAVTAGRYLKARYNKDGEIVSAALAASAETLTGDVVSLSPSVITLRTAAGDLRKLTISSLTAVSCGGKTGGSELIEDSGEYEEALCVADQNGGLYTLVLSGGSFEEEGIIAEMDKESLLFSGLDGKTMRIAVEKNTAVTVNGLSSAWDTAYAGLYEGKRAVLRLSSDDGSLKSVEVDTTCEMIQAAVSELTLNTDPKMIYVKSLSGKKVTGYPLTKDTEYFDEGEKTTAEKLLKDDFITLRLKNNKVEAVWTYPGAVETEGKLSKLTFGASISLCVTEESGNIVEFSLDPDEVPPIWQGSVRISIDKLKTGDSLTVYTEYNKITKISAKMASATLEGTVTGLSTNLSGTVLTLADEKGEEREYILADGVVIKKDGKTTNLYAIKAGDEAALTIRNGEVTEIEVLKQGSAVSELSGTVLYINRDDSTFLLKTVNSAGNTVNVNVVVNGNTKMWRAEDAATITMTSLEIMDEVQVFGAYSGGDYKATLVIVR